MLKTSDIRDLCTTCLGHTPISFLHLNVGVCPFLKIDV